MLGPLEVHDDSGAEVAVPGNRLRALLIILALHPGRVVPATHLIDGIWPGRPPAQAKNALQTLVSRLRRAIPGAVIESRPHGYRLDLDQDAVDVTRFERLVSLARTRETALPEALALWRGPALQEVANEEFFAAPVARLTDLRLSAIEEQAEAGIRLGHASDLITELTSLVAEHPLRERMAGALMRALTAAGRPAEALAAYERTRKALADTLGTDPSPELSALHTAVLRGELTPDLTNEHGQTTVNHISEPATRPSARDITRPPREGQFLRASLTSFIGRDADLAQVSKLVSEYRLITLTGPGGSGKTRLATEAARSLLDQQPDGLWLVELAPIAADVDVPRAVLAAMGVQESGADPVDQLAGALHARQALLVLDNCEHLIDTVAVLADRLLGACPELRILATSRQPLGIIGEALWPVEPLAVAPEGADAAEAMASPAVRLLVDRANAACPGFEVTVPAVIRICRALDGMPLAIELAAARMRSMTAEQVAGRLDDRFRLLKGNRAALPRHQTLRAVIDWSWDLLTDEERTVLRRLAVFSRGATVEAAERVCGDNALEILDALADKSLLVPTGDDSPRYGMLETIKEYGLLKLTEAGELQQIRQAHAEYFADLVQTADQHLRGANQMVWLKKLATDHDNIDAAVRSAVQSQDAATAVRLVAGAGWYWLLDWWLRGRKSAGANMAADALALPGPADDTTRGIACMLSALFNLSGNGDEKLAREWFATARRISAQNNDPMLRLVEPLGHMVWAQDHQDVAYPFDDQDPWTRAVARLAHATALLSVGRLYREAEAGLVAALDGFRAVGDRWGITYALHNLSDVLAFRGDFPGAISHSEEAMAVTKEFVGNRDIWKPQLRLVQLRWLLGDHEGVAATVATAEREAIQIGLPDAVAAVTYTKAEVARWSGDSATARAYLGQVADLTRQISLNWQFRAMMHDSLGYLDTCEGHVDSGREHRTGALSWALRSKSAYCIGQILVGIADQALHQNQPYEAAQLLAAGDAVRGTPDKSMPDIARIEAAARTALTDEQFAHATEHGHTATIETIHDFTAATLQV
jgi:predicted ATPase/DNA-binding SARP family transcriptional activator